MIDITPEMFDGIAVDVRHARKLHHRDNASCLR